MNSTTAIFLDIRLPNAVTWFYFTLLLAVALFFKFSRFLSIRNLDLVSLFLLMPGLLLLDGLDGAPDAGGRLAAYVWLLCASGYYFARCLADLALVRRPALSPNLGPAGLAWLAGTLYVSLVAVAVYRPDSVERGSWIVDREEGEQSSEDVVSSQERRPPGHESRSTIHDPRSTIAQAALALACHLAIAVGLVLVARAHFEDLHAGLAAAALYLLLPYTHFFLPGRGLDVPVWEHVLPMTLLVYAVLAYRRPALAGALVGLAAGSVFFPLLALPPWVSFYWRRGLPRFLAGFGVALAGCLVALALLWYFGESTPALWPRAAWQPWLPPETDRSVWQPSLAHWVYRVPIFLAYAAFMLATAFWPSPKNLAHLIALTAALLVGIQFWYADRGGVYVFWYLPFLLLLMFRPNLSAATAPIVDRGSWIVDRVRSWVASGRGS